MSTFYAEVVPFGACCSMFVAVRILRGWPLGGRPPTRDALVREFGMRPRTPEMWINAWHAVQGLPLPYRRTRPVPPQIETCMRLVTSFAPVPEAKEIAAHLGRCEKTGYDYRAAWLAALGLPSIQHNGLTKSRRTA